MRSIIQLGPAQPRRPQSGTDCRSRRETVSGAQVSSWIRGKLAASLRHSTLLGVLFDEAVSASRGAVPAAEYSGPGA